MAFIKSPIFFCALKYTQFGKPKFNVTYRPTLYNLQDQSRLFIGFNI